MKKNYPILILNNEVPFTNIDFILEMTSSENKKVIDFATKHKINQVVVTTRRDDKVSVIENGVIFSFNNRKKDSITLKSLGKVRILEGLKKYSTENIVVEEALIKEKAEDSNDGVYIALCEHTPEVVSEHFSTNYQIFLQNINNLLGESFKLKDENPTQFVNFIASNEGIFFKNERIKMLSVNNYTDRMKLILSFLNSRKNKRNINNTTKNALAEGSNNLKDQNSQENKKVDKFIEKVNAFKGPSYIKKVVFEERDKLMSLHPTQSEYSVVKNYLTSLISIPWNKETKDTKDLKVAEKILDKNHYGLDEVKERIVEFLAVKSLKNNLKGPIICLVGPPGVGKTSLCRSIASSLGRKYQRISLGGVRDESEIRGHRRTYVGAMPGKIIKSITKAESKNPVIVLDEIDKMGQSNQGDPTAAMLEVLDPEQNHTFMDHYLDVPFDLSSTLFIATANYIQNIPEALRDRMEIIDLSGYTASEKFKISKTHLIDVSLLNHGIKGSQFSITDNAIKSIIEKYTREAGVRDLKRKFDTLSRYTAKEIAYNNKKKVSVTDKNLIKILGNKTIESSIIKHDVAGLVNGLAWTQVGGKVLNIESSFYEEAAKTNKLGSLSVSGSLKEVMKESANLSMMLIRSKTKDWKVDKKNLSRNIHLHVPSGATPKDGPSAGVTFTTCLMSLLTNKTIPSDVAMTGEISLKGFVLPVGGVKEKIMGAYKEDVKKVYIPHQNMRDIEEIPKEILNSIEVVGVKTVDEILKDLELI